MYNIKMNDVAIITIIIINCCLSSELNSTVSLRKTDSTAPLKSLLALWKKLMSGNPLIKGDYNVEKVSLSCSNVY